MDGTGMKDIIELIANVGFPCVVAAYLLVRMETRIAQLAENISELARVLQNLDK